MTGVYIVPVALQSMITQTDKTGKAIKPLHSVKKPTKPSLFQSLGSTETTVCHTADALPPSLALVPHLFCS